MLGRPTRSGTVYYFAITVVFTLRDRDDRLRPTRDYYLFLLGASPYCEVQAR